MVGDMFLKIDKTKTWIIYLFCTQIANENSSDEVSDILDLMLASVKTFKSMYKFEIT